MKTETEKFNVKGKEMDLFELQNKIHAQNKELGWWDEPRPFSTFVCLFHSELSEAMEGDRKGLMDDHLPHYEMFWVELADFVIRCMDFLGSVCDSDPYKGLTVGSGAIDRIKMLSTLHWFVSESLSSQNDGFWSDRDDQLISAVLNAIQLAMDNDVDLYQIIQEKVEYNKHRADHKRENRAKEGGKRY